MTANDLPQIDWLPENPASLDLFLKAFGLKLPTENKKRTHEERSDSEKNAWENRSKHYKQSSENKSEEYKLPQPIKINSNNNPASSLVELMEKEFLNSPPQTVNKQLKLTKRVIEKLPTREEMNRRVEEANYRRRLEKEKYTQYIETDEYNENYTTTAGH